MSAGKLPEGWVETQLENIVDILDSMRVPVNNSERQSRIAGKKENELYPYFGATGEVGKIDDYIFDEELVALGEDGVPFFDGHKNKAYMLYGKTWVNNHAHVIRAISGLSHNKYLCHYLNQFDYHDYVNGGTRLKLTQANMRKLPVSLAPLAEQKIIAEKLDTLLAQVESTKARLEHIPQILKRFRQAVLHVAVSGKLTEKWRLENATLENSYEWKIQSLSDLGVLARGKSKHRPRNDPRLFGDKYPFIQTGEVANSSGRIKGANKFYSEFGLSQSKLFPKDTLCITIAANIADTAILEIEACFPDSVVGFISDRNKSHVSFVKYLIDVNKDNLEAFAPATAQKNINLKVLNELKLPIPDIKEQREIVRRVEQLFAYADTIEKQVNNALARVNNLTQSILAKAFRGGLTAQWRVENPELLSGENSAAALLEKIKAERAASGGKKASRKKS
ncbi:restriction endonuclease subunit S [Escherichia coli]|uniref:restriction endonuclease subunit S n=1 Tax=Escherichia coli TaxID=562 RepID=UPI001A01EC80|nr:restriction endonuclease subunit S [Escherichia coli]HAO9127479.1 restriction endonuclease subunit S [Escherichia coli]